MEWRAEQLFRNRVRELLRQNGSGATDEDEGLVVVTLLLVVRRVAGLGEENGGSGALARQLDALASLYPDHLLAFQIIWTPDDPNHSLAPENIEHVFPELEKVE